MAGPATEDRLDSWKEIATYLKRDVTTVQRWEKREGMPVHRHLHDKLGSVYAFRSELDAWSRGRHARPLAEGDASRRHHRYQPLRHADIEPDHDPRSLTRRLIAGRSRHWRQACAPGSFDRADYFWRNPLDRRTVSDG